MGSKAHTQRETIYHVLISSYHDQRYKHKHVVYMHAHTHAGTLTYTNTQTNTHERRHTLSFASAPFSRLVFMFLLAHAHTRARTHANKHARAHTRVKYINLHAPLGMCTGVLCHTFRLHPALWADVFCVENLRPPSYVLTAPRCTHGCVCTSQSVPHSCITYP
jgi:hypothetical protein